MLPRLFDDLAYARVVWGRLDEVHRLLDVVDGWGSCRHPDGTVRLARSALDVFAADIVHHRAGRSHAALVAARDADHRDLR